MALRKILILRRLAERGLEGRATPVQTIANFPTPAKVGVQGQPLYSCHPYIPVFAGMTMGH
jgi:hypothetical protein